MPLYHIALSKKFNRTFSFLLLLSVLYSCSSINSKNDTKTDTTTKVGQDSLADDSISHTSDDEGFEHDSPSDTAIIGNTRFILKVLNKQTDSLCFVVEKEINGVFKMILKDPTYQTNNSTLFWADANGDGYLDIVWTRKWQDHAYLYNPRIQNFSEVGEYHTIDTLKLGNIPLFYNNKYPLLYYWNYEKSFWTEKCGDDTSISENHSELFIINDNYQKISFATLDNFSTFNDRIRDTITCGAQIINCYIPPYYGKFGEYSIWNNGKSIDSFWIEKNKSFYDNESYSIDSSFITDYWLEHYQKLLQYGQVFKVRRELPLEYH